MRNDKTSFLTNAFKDDILPEGIEPRGYRRIQIPLTKQQRIKRERSKRARKARRIHRRAAK